MATLLLAAHKLKMTPDSQGRSAGATGEVSSVTVGPITKSFVAKTAAAGGGNTLELTSYGIEYMRLKKTLPHRAAVL
jgi:hypothetical protein